MRHTTLLALLGTLSYTRAASIDIVQQPISSFDLARTSHHETCKQAPALFPEKHKQLDRVTNELFNQNSFQLRAFEALGAIVRVP